MTSLELAQSPSNYRADIDIIRAVAIIGVIIYHVFPNILPGGFIGVDVFFVISGYLITNNIYTPILEDRFNMIKFYERRVRRLFPTLILVIIFTLAFGLLTMSSKEQTQLNSHIIGSLGFYANFIFMNEHGYFNNANDTNPLAHIWSLAIEEQFYLLWPAILILTFKIHITKRCIIGFIIASFVYSVYLLYQNNIIAFYSPAARFWELMTGCLAAVISKQPKKKGGKKRRFLVLFILSIIVASMFTIHHSMAFPGYIALVPVFCTFGLILLNHSPMSTASFTSKLAVAIGQLSYPLYLWHWPVLVFYKILFGEKISAAAGAACILTSCLLSYFSYKGVERLYRRASAPRPAWELMVGVVIVGCATFTLLPNEPQHVDPENSSLEVKRWQPSLP